MEVCKRAWKAPVQEDGWLVDQTSNLTDALTQIHVFLIAKHFFDVSTHNVNGTRWRGIFVSSCSMLAIMWVWTSEAHRPNYNWKLLHNVVTTLTCGGKNNTPAYQTSHYLCYLDHKNDGQKTTTTILLEQELQANKSCITCTGTAFHLSTTNLINAPPLFGPSLDLCCLHVNRALPRNNVLRLNSLMAAVSRITILRLVLLIETVESSENLVRSWSHRKERDLLRDLILILQLGTKIFDSLVNLQPPSIIWDNMGILDIAPTLKERVRTM